MSQPVRLQLLVWQTYVRPVRRRGNIISNHNLSSRAGAGLPFAFLVWRPTRLHVFYQPTSTVYLLSRVISHSLRLVWDKSATCIIIPRLNYLELLYGGQHDCMCSTVYLLSRVIAHSLRPVWDKSAPAPLEFLANHDLCSGCACRGACSVQTVGEPTD